MLIIYRQLSNDEYGSKSPINDADELSDDFIFGLVHHAVHGVIGVAHAIFGSPINDADDVSDDFIWGLKHQRFHTPSLNHHVLGLTSGSPINDADELSDDFIFGLIHHAVHGVLGVAHAILGSPINE